MNRGSTLFTFLIIFLHGTEKKVNVTTQNFLRIHVLCENEEGEGEHRTNLVFNYIGNTLQLQNVENQAKPR